MRTREVADPGLKHVRSESCEIGASELDRLFQGGKRGKEVEGEAMTNGVDCRIHTKL